MLQFQVIGNLGGDARLNEENGNKFVSFNVAHQERWIDANGNQHESVTWVSCIINGDGGKLLPFLVKGRQVYVYGRGSVRQYHSPKLHQLVAGAQIQVDKIELIGGQPEEIPRTLYDMEGIAHSVNKAYWIQPQEAKELGAKKDNPVQLLSKDGRYFSLDSQGWVRVVVENSEAEQQQ